MARSLQDKGRRGSRTCDEEFVLYLQGIPAHCRWQELKDFVRQTALHIRQAVVYDDQHGYPTGIGQIIVKNEDEAWRTFRKLASNGWDGQALTVTLARASSPTRPIAGPTRSSSATLPTLPYNANYPINASASTPISTASVATDLGTVSPSSYPPLAAVPLLGSAPLSQQGLQGLPTTMSTGFCSSAWTANPEAHTFSPALAVLSPPFNQMEYPYYPNPMPLGQPIYSGVAPSFQAPPIFIHTNSYYQPGYPPCHYEPHNTGMYPPTEGYASVPRTFQLPPTCTIIVNNISPSVDAQILKDHLQSVGTVVQCEIIPTDEKGKHTHNLGHYAMATFQSAEEAERAVLHCNGTMLAGNRLTVRLHLDSSSIFPVPVPATAMPDEDWSSSSTTSSFFPQQGSAASGPSPSFSGEGWNMFLRPTSTTSTSSSSTVVPSPSYPGSASDMSTEPSARLRRDSGKELILKDQAEEKEETCKETNSSVSPTLSAESASANHQPLVVNGSMAGRAKM